MGRTAHRLAAIGFLLLVVSLAWARDPLMIRGLPAEPTDLLFAVTFGFWLIALISGETRLRLHRSFWLLATYFAAMALSLSASKDIGTSAFKLLTEMYLLLLPVLAYNLVRDAGELKRTLGAWIIAAGVIGLIGTVAVIAFPFAGRSSILGWTYHNYGTLPPGPYPRLQISFDYPAMLANYLGVALMLILAAQAEGWMSRRQAVAIGALVAISCLFTLTPGLGGILFMAGVWGWYRFRQERPRLAVAVLALACAVAVPAVFVASVAIVRPASPPYQIVIPGLPPLSPSVRLLAWGQAAANALASPLVGHGIGIDAVDVDYMSANCGLHCVSDAHNSFLSLAAQCGAVGLLALVALVAFVGMAFLRAVRARSPISVALSLAWLGSLAVEGLVGSFEDQRHLWVLFGLILSAEQAFPGPRADRRLTQVIEKPPLFR
jgi:O-antigen ligase